MVAGLMQESNLIHRCLMKILKKIFESNWLTASRIALLLSGALLICSCSSGGAPESAKNSEATPSPSANTGSKIATDAANKYASLDTSSNSVQKMTATVHSQDGSVRTIDLTIYNKRVDSGGRQLMVEFDSPQERDRDAVIDINPNGDIQATRYVQSSDSFLTAKSPTDEESLFGLTLQELVGGQPEKYNYTLVDEETHNQVPVYKLEGKLKSGQLSRFPRLVMLVSKADYTAPLIEAYDDQNQLARKITVEKSQQVDGIWTRMAWTIDNVADHKKIDFVAKEVKYNQKLDASAFDRNRLKKLATKG